MTRENFSLLSQDTRPTNYAWHQSSITTRIEWPNAPGVERVLLNILPFCSSQIILVVRSTIESKAIASQLAYVHLSTNLPAWRLRMGDNVLPTPQVQELSSHFSTENTANKKVINGLHTLWTEGTGGISGQAMPLSTLQSPATVL
jgi:hypothetical protein